MSTDRKRVSNAGAHAVLARNLRAVRRERGLTMEELARRSGVSRGMLSKMENAQSSPTVLILERVAEVLGVRAGELLMTRSARVEASEDVVGFEHSG